MFTPTVQVVEAMNKACSSALESDDTRYAAGVFMEKIQEAESEREAVRAILELIHEVIAKTATEIAVSLFDIREFHKCCEELSSLQLDDELRDLLDNQ
jgi:hypothetical protein